MLNDNEGWKGTGGFEFGKKKGWEPWGQKTGLVWQQKWRPLLPRRHSWPGGQSSGR